MDSTNTSQSQGIKPEDLRENLGLFELIFTPLGRASTALAIGAILSAVSYYGFFRASPIGDPFVQIERNFWDAIVRRNHDQAYAEHPIRPVKPRHQFFNRAFLELFESKQPPINGLLYDIAENTWRLNFALEGAPLDRMRVRRLFSSRDRQKLGAITLSRDVYFFEDGRWRSKGAETRGDVIHVETEFVLKGHKSVLNAAVFSGDGSRVATGDADGEVRLWDAQTGKEVATLLQKGASILSLRFSPDDSRLVSADAKGMVKLWDVNSSKQIATLSEQEGAVNEAVFSSDGSRIVAASTDKTVRIWDTVTGHPLSVLQGHTGSVEYAEFSPDGSRVLSASTDGTARLWDTSTAALLAVLSGHSDSIMHAAFSPGGRLVMTASKDSTVRVWDADSGRLFRTFSGHEKSVISANFSNNGEHLVSASADGTARVWSVETGELTAVLRGHPSTVYQAEYSADDRMIATASADNTARIWDAESGLLRSVLSGHSDEVIKAKFSSDGRRVITTSHDSTARIWQLSFSGDQTVNATALDMTSGVIFGEQKLLDLNRKDGQSIPSFFPNTIRSVTELDSGSRRVAVGDEGSIYIGFHVELEGKNLTDSQNSTALRTINVKKSESTDQSDSDQTIPRSSTITIVDSIEALSQKLGDPIGTIAGYQWYSVSEARNDLDSASALRAVAFSADTGVAVGDNGLVKVTFDGGITWQSRRVGGEHAPDLRDVRVDGARNYAVAVGLSKSQDAPPYAILFSTNSLRAQSPGNSSGLGDWKHLPWAAGAPMMAYAALLLALIASLVALYSVRLWWITRPTEARPVAAGKSDREIGWDDDDALGLKQLAMQVSKFLRNAQTEPPLVLGVVGGWGSGKSSLMNLLREDLAKRGTSAVEFNAWHHQNEEHLLAALFEAVRSRALPRLWTLRGIWFRLRLIGPRLWRQTVRFLPFLVIASCFAILASAWLTDGDLAALRSSSDPYLKMIKGDDGGIYGPAYLVGLVPAAGLALWLRTLWVAMPAQPAKLLKKFGALARVNDFRDKLSFRYSFGESFKEVCRALRMPGVPGLVIFIDDLDRCQAKSVLTIFEAVNYFVSVGDCIVVMGFDRAQVEHSIGNELKDIADGMPDDEVPFAFGGDRRRAYARHYMEKLINLEVAIPRTTPRAAVRLAQVVEIKNFALSDKENRWLGEIRPRILSALEACRSTIWLIFVVAAVWFGFTQSENLYGRVTSKPINESQTQNTISRVDRTNSIQTGNAQPSSRATPKVEAQRNAQTSVSEDLDQKVLIPQEAEIAPVFKKYDKSDLWVLWPLFVTIGFLVFWVFLRRAYTISKDVEHDPQPFVDALKEANQVVEGVNPTPRAIKRFMNRMRFASARMRKVNYQTGLVDWIAHKIGFVTADFEKHAESPPSMSDAKVVALGTLEAFAQLPPDSKSDNRSPEMIVDERIALSGNDLESVAIGERIKELLRSARVDRDSMLIYAETFGSTGATLPSESGDQSTDVETLNVRKLKPEVGS